jgi:hypothetical protein
MRFPSSSDSPLSYGLSYIKATEILGTRNNSECRVCRSFWILNNLLIYIPYLSDETQV